MTGHHAVVRQLRLESDDVLSIELAPLPGSTLPAWTPGAHLDVHLPGGLVRQYSLCGRRDDETWRIAVLREPSSRGGSSYVHDQLRPGDVLTLSAPRNNFELEPAPRYLFIAGGVGITPILPKLVEAERRGAAWQLLYGGKQRSSMAFLAELATYGDRVSVLPQDEAGLLPVRSTLEAQEPGTSVHCCGPAPLIEAVVGAATDLGLQEVHVERFAAAATQPVSGDGFEVLAVRAGVRVVVPPDTSILEALEGAGLSPFHSCREGICGSCETKVLSGQVDHRDSLLSPSEKESGETMMICVSRSRGGPLELDL
jgi:ferredoxin-NADP reductase